MPRVLFLPLALAASLTGCSTPPIYDVAFEAAALAIDGDIGIGSSSVPGTSSVQALGLEDDDFAPGGRVEVDWDGPHLTLSGLWSDNSGDGQLEAPMSQGNVTIPAGTDVDSEFELGLYSAVLTFDLAPSERWEAGIGFGVAVIDLDAGFTSQANNDEIFTDEVLPVPVLSGRLGWRWERLALTALVSGIGIDYGGDRAAYFDADLRAEFRVLGRENRTQGLLVAGWRFLSASVDYESSDEAVDADVDLTGPFVGLVLRF